MKLLDKVAWGIDDLLYRVGSTTKQTIDSYCDLDTGELNSDHALVYHNGTLGSLVDISGAVEIGGAAEYDRLLDMIHSQIGPLLRQSAYSMQFVFEYDPEEKSAISIPMEHIRRGAQRNKLSNVDDILDDMAQALSRKCAFERATLVLTTTSALLGKKEIVEARKEAAAFAKENLPTGRGTQDVSKSLASVVDIHHAFVDRVVDVLMTEGVDARVYKQHDACRLIRQQVDSEFTSEQWRPHLAGDTLAPTFRGTPDAHATDLAWMPLANQLIPRDPISNGLHEVIIGDRIFRPLQIEKTQTESKQFPQLSSNLRKNRVPYRVSFRIGGDGLSRTQTRNNIAGYTSFASSQNRRIRRAFSGIEEYVRDRSGIAVSLSMTAVTWADKDDHKTLNQRFNRLATALQSWGGIDVGNVAFPPMDVFAQTCAGLRLTSTANMACEPLPKVTRMLPWMRPTSPWDHGPMLFASNDGKLFPYTALSKKQDASISLINAPMGRGKSVLLNALNLALCLDETNKNLPMIRMLDIGFSSSGLISVLRDALPESRKHEALYKKMRMTPDCAINPLDTPLGCRQPLPGHSAFLDGLLSLMTTPLDADAPADGMPGIAKMVINMAYNNFSDEQAPKIYNRGVDREVDEALDSHNIATDASTSWWEVTDALVAVHDHVTAYRAQSYAMPLLSDCAALARSKAVTDVYTGHSPTGEDMGTYFWRLINEAVTDYPILNAPTKLNFGAAKVISLDMQDVCPSGKSGKAARQTAVMYSMAMWVMSSDFFIGEESLAQMPNENMFKNKDMLTKAIPDYQSYHSDRINTLRESKKRIGADEFHRTQGSVGVRDIFKTIIREGRKWKVEVILASQLQSDFDDDMIELATSMFILGAGGKKEAGEICERLGLSSSAEFIIDKKLNGPGAGGSPLLAVFKVKGEHGYYIQFISNVQGSRVLWAFSTSSDDVLLRNRLYKKIGTVAARNILAQKYPGGSVGGEIERRTKILESNNDMGESFDNDGDILGDIEQELLDAYNSLAKS